MGHRVIKSPDDTKGSLEQVVVLAGEDGRLVDVESGRVKVVPGGNTPDDPVYVTNTNGYRAFHQVYAVNAEVSAEIVATLGGPYEVGGQDFTVAINGEATPTVVSFQARAAQGGYLYGGTYPNLKDGFPNNVAKMKVSVDGGSLVEIEIAKTYMDFDSIAAAIQTEIRSSVENGAGTIVKWNDPQFPYRFAAWSATAGSNSSIHFEGGYLSKELKISAGYGLKEVLGLDANMYSEPEVFEILDSGLHDVEVHGPPCVMTTKRGGTEASLNVTSGGANTALGFPTGLVTGQAGTGDKNLFVDGSTYDVRFSVPIPTSRIFAVEELVFLMRTKDAQLKKFGALSELVNGIAIEFRVSGQVTRALYEAKTVGEVFAFADESEILLDSHADGNDLIKAKFMFAGGGLRLTAGTMDTIEVTVRDNLTGSNMFYFHVLAKGWLEI